MLSDAEQRFLDEIEAQLHASDPRFAQGLATGPRVGHANAGGGGPLPERLFIRPVGQRLTSGEPARRRREMTRETVRDVMTIDPICLPDSANIVEAAKRMRARNIGDVLVLDSEDHLEGMVTDRDIVIRAIAAGREPSSTLLGEVVSTDCVTVNVDEPLTEAVRLMRDNGLRRLPVMEEGHVVGIVSLGDLAIERDPTSALAEISNAPPNR
jgi:CBS domain-containing protein